MSQWIPVLCAASLAAVLAACEVFAPAVPPYCYDTLEFLCGPMGSIQKTAGVRLGVTNSSSKVVRSLVLDFFVWKEGCGYPEPGLNHFVRTVHVNMRPGARSQIHVCLDDAFFFVPSGPLVLERLHISRVDYEGGASWSDPWAIHVHPGPVVVEEA